MKTLSDQILKLVFSSGQNTDTQSTLFSLSIALCMGWDSHCVGSMWWHHLWQSWDQRINLLVSSGRMGNGTESTILLLRQASMHLCVGCCVWLWFLHRGGGTGKSVVKVTEQLPHEERQFISLERRKQSKRLKKNKKTVEKVNTETLFTKLCK